MSQVSFRIRYALGLGFVTVMARPNGCTLNAAIFRMVPEFGIKASNAFNMRQFVLLTMN